MFSSPPSSQILSDQLVHLLAFDLDQRLFVLRDR